MRKLSRKLYSRIVSAAFAFVVAVSGVTGIVPFLFASEAGAIGSTETIYDALPSVTPSNNYASVGYEATSTKELGDSIHLGGTDRVLNTVTVTLSNWAKYSDYASNPTYSGDNQHWTMPMTVNVYANSTNVDGTPSTLIASKNQTVSIPWRPESDPNCADTSNGKGWTESGTCFNYSGIASNATFDFSDQYKALPSDVIVSVVYNTQHHGYAPTGVAGPYNSLNVAVPDNQVVSVGSDNDTNAIFWNTDVTSWYSDGAGVASFRKDSNWAPNGTMAVQITAGPIAAPTNLRFIKNGTVTTLASGSYVKYTGITLYWDTVPNAERYQIQVTDPSGNVQANRYTGWYTFALDDTSRYGFFGTQQGEWQYQVRTKDATTGLWSAYTSPVSMNFDNVRSGISINNPTTNGGIVHSSENLSVTATDNVELDRVTLNIYSGQNGTGTLLKSTSPHVSGTSYTLDVPVASLAEGSYSFKTNATDKAGNQISPTLTRNFVVDNDVTPTATIQFGGIGPAFTGFSVQFNEAVNQAEAENAANYFLNNWEGAGGSGDLAGDATVSYDTTTHKATVSFNSPFWYLSAEQQWGVENIHDLAGNVIAYTPAYTSPLVNPTNPGTPTVTSAANDASIDWTWAASTDPGGVQASGLKGYEYAFVNQGDTPTTWTFTTATSVTTPAPADGSYSLVVRAVDNAGNRSDSATGNFTVDTTAPDLTINGYTGTDTTPTLTGTTENASDVVVVDGDSANPAVVEAIANGDGTYNWSYTLPTQTTGTHPITVVSTDVAGNSSTETATVTVVAAAPLETPNNTDTATPVQTVTITPNNNQGVLGDETNTPSDEATQNSVVTGNDDTSEQGVKAASDTNNQGTIFGLAWYWWLLILAVIAAIIAWIVAAYRKRAPQE